MRYLCLICAEKVMEQMPEAEADQHYEEYREFTHDMRRGGYYLDCNRLLPADAATTVRVRNGKLSVTDGPFAETKEQFGGYYLIEARDLNEAIAVAAKIPGARKGCVEIRPVAEDARTLDVLGLNPHPDQPAAARNFPKSDRMETGAVASQQNITPCLWFNDEAEPAAEFYTGIFPNSVITRISRYGEAGREIHGKAPGSVMAVAFELDGQPFTALNGGPRPHFQFNEAISFQVSCETQAEVDHYWRRLSAGGEKRAQQCGWLKDRYGISWQIVPSVLPRLISDPDSRKSQQTFQAMLQMKKLDIAILQQAHDR